MKRRTIKHITHWSLSYYIFSLYVHAMHWLFYKKIVVEGKENIPDAGPVIFAPNHQNALMDALAILSDTKKQIVFLARADIFNIPLLPAFFRWIKILPIYRIRDGAKNLKHNDDTFDAAIQVLRHNHSIGLFPEAAHSNKRHLLGFKKGIPRIAFQAEEENDFKLGIQILPVGIYYSKYNTFRSILHIRYGTPIPVEKYHVAFAENPNKAMLSLRDEMKSATKQLVIHISKLDFYDMYESVRVLYFKNMAKRLQIEKLNPKNSFVADKMTIQRLDKFSEQHPEQMDSLKRKIDALNKYKHKYALSNQSLEKERINVFRLLWNAFLLLLFLPVFVYGALNNLLPYILPKMLVLLVKDKQFHSSIKFVWGIFFIPVFYLIQFFVFWSFSHHLLWAFLYLLSLPLTGMLAQLYFEWAVLITKDLNLYILKKISKKSYLKIRTLYDEIMQYLDKILSVSE